MARRVEAAGGNPDQVKLLIGAPDGKVYEYGLEDEGSGVVGDKIVSGMQPCAFR